MHSFLKAILVSLLLAGFAGQTAAQAGCGGWNTAEFFRAATVDQVQACLAAGADVNARDKEGWTPLHWAALSNENPAVVVTLLAAGADVNAREKDGWTPLHVAAASNENPAAVEAPLAAGADPRAKTKYSGAPSTKVSGRSPRH